MTTKKQTATLRDLLAAAGSRWVEAMEHDYDPKAECIGDLVDRFDEEPECLKDFGHSDWINLCEPYTRDLLRRYDQQCGGIKAWFDDYCEAIGATSALEALEGQTIEDPEDMAAAMVNTAMTYAAMELCREVFPEF